MMRRALEIDERLLGPGHWKTAVDLNNLAAVLVKMKRLPDAEQLMRRAVDLERRVDPGSLSLANAAINLGEVLALEKKWEEAAAFYGEALRLWEGRSGPPPDGQLAVLTRYEQILRQIHEYARAEQVGARAMRIRVRAALERSLLPR